MWIELLAFLILIAACDVFLIQFVKEGWTYVGIFMSLLAATFIFGSVQKRYCW